MTTTQVAPGGSIRSEDAGTLERRALAIWPRLDRTALRRCHNDAHRIVTLVARRTTMPPESILSMLTMPRVADDDIDTWFG